MISRIVIEEALKNKAAHAVAVTTTTTGVGTVFDLIPDDIGKLATLLGIILTSVLIYFHVTRGRADIRKTNLEIKKLESDIKKLEEAKQAPAK